MWLYLYHTGFVILTGFVLTTLAYNNTAPKWAKNLQMRCNCMGNTQCDTRGSCGTSGCIPPYGGITCQHATLDLFDPKPKFPNELKELLDGDQSTCLPSPISTTSVITINDAVHFFWTYIFAKSPIVKNPHIELYKGGVNQNIDPVYKIFNKTSILIKLRQGAMYDEIRLSTLPADACTLDISLGRNLAFGSSADQSSVYLSNTTASNALAAIDGNEKGEGVETGFPIQPTEWWKIRLQFDSIINSVVIIPAWGYACRLKKFVLETFTPDGTAAFHYQDQTTAPFTSGIFVHAARKDKLTKEVKISVSQDGSLGCYDHGMIYMQEVYVYGEIHCPANYYGSNCDKFCSGCLRGLCDSEWVCVACKKDFMGDLCEINCQFHYGERCQHPCSDNCAGIGDCTRDHGVCLEGCRAGFYLPNCSNPCPPSSSGINCSRLCTYCRMNKTTGVRPCDGSSGECLLGCANGQDDGECEKIKIIDDTMQKVTTFVFYAAFGILFLIILYRSMVYQDEEISSEEEEAGEVQTSPEEKVISVDPEPPIKDEVLLPDANPEHTDRVSTSTDRTTDSELSNTEPSKINKAEHESSISTVDATSDSESEEIIIASNNHV